MELEINKELTDIVLVAGQAIASPEALASASSALSLGKGLERKIKAFFAPLKQGAHDSWKRICDQENVELAKLKPALTVLERSIVDYRVAQDRIRREAEEKARRQEEERRRLEAAAMREAEEKARKAEEEQRRIDREAAAQKLAAQNRELAERIERERREKQEALAAKAKADQDAIIDKAAAAEAKLGPVVIVPERIANTSGVSMRDNWVLEVIDEQMIPREYCVPDWTRLNKLAKIEKEKLNIPGVRAVNKPVSVARIAGTNGR